MRQFLITLVLTFVVFGSFEFTAREAQACPMCKTAIEEESNVPRAYMLSILFMLAMPATIFTGLGRRLVSDE